ncbi:hypothetical protein FPV67DRAFT_1222990 [Lyophyllum atratum]|nr:hypothetical protein FPV67DRAFT_1222990 [Lyophyllum atratum]
MDTHLERVLFQKIGFVLLQNLTRFAAITLLYAMFIGLFAYTMITTKWRGLAASRPTWTMLCATLLSFTIVNVYWGAFLASFWIEIRGYFFESNTPLNPAKVNAVAYRIYAASRISLWTSLLLHIPNDCVVVWRAWVLFSENRSVMIAPIILLLGTTATILTYLILHSNLDAYRKEGSSVVSSSSDFNTASLVLSLATNIVTTSMIMYKLWTHRQFLSNLELGRRKTPSVATRSLLVIVESGLLYFLLQVSILIMQSLSLSPRLANSMAFNIVVAASYPVYLIFTGMYPMIVVLLVKNQKSMVQTFGFTTMTGVYQGE